MGNTCVGEHAQSAACQVAPADRRVISLFRRCIVIENQPTKEARG